MKFPPEAELLLGTVQTHVDSATAARLVALLHQELNWSFLLRAASRHRLLPLFHLTLARLTTEGIEGQCCTPDRIPPDVRRALQEHYALNLRRNFLLTSQLFRLLDAFEARGVLALPYKGPVLSAFLYGNLGSRQFLDVDVLTPPSQVRSALEVLVEQGFEPPSFWGSEREVASFELGQRHECSLFHPQTRMSLELHWRTQGLHFSRELTANELHRHLRTFQLQGRDVPIFAPEELLLLLASHGVRHFWWRLQWLCDLGRLLATQTLDWDMIWRRARASGEKRRLLVSLILANQCLGAPLPPQIKDWCDADKRAQDLARQLRNEWFFEPMGMAQTETRILQLLNHDTPVSGASMPLTTVSLPLVNQALGSTGAAASLRLGESNDEVQQLTQQLSEFLLHNLETPMWNVQRLHLQMRERPQDKVRYLWWKWLAPQKAELEMLSLPRPLRHFYVPFRFLRLAGKYGIRSRRLKRVILRVVERR